MLKKQRESNFELLRIIAMLFIVIFHVMTNCVRPQLSQVDLFSNPPHAYKRILLLYCSMLCGTMGNNIFILISGYFLAGKAEINIGNTIKKIISQVAFAACVLTLGSFAHYLLINRQLGVFMDISCFNDDWWFVGYYLVIVVIGGLFLNRYLMKQTQKQQLTLLAILFAIFSLPFPGGILAAVTYKLRVLTSGIFLYVLGGYIRKYNPFERVKTRAIVAFMLLLGGLVLISQYNIMIGQINVFYLNHPDSFDYAMEPAPDFTISVLLLAISVFEIGRRIPVKHSRVINYIGASTFMNYLIHENRYMHAKWKKYDWITTYYYRPLVFFGWLLLWVILTFLMGIVFYAIYEGIQKMISSKTFKNMFFKSESES